MTGTDIITLAGESVELQVRRKHTRTVIDEESRQIFVYFKETKFYSIGGSETIVSEDINHYMGDYEESEASELGTAIKAKIETRLALEDPNNPPAPAE